MKRHTKKTLSICGLLGVAAMTGAALAIPYAHVSAAPSASVTDTIKVRVTADAPDVEITGEGINSGFSTTSPLQSFTATYNAEVGKITAVLTYTDLEGNEYTKTLVSKDTGFQEGSWTEEFDLRSIVEDTPEGGTPSTNTFGYGRYRLKLTGEGYNGVTDSSELAFDYLPVGSSDDNTPIGGELEVTVDDDGNGHVELGYDTDTNEIAYTEVYVYDETGRQVINKFTVPADTTDLVIPFGSYGLPTGEYTVSSVPYDRDGKQLSIPYEFTVYYEAPAPVPVPDTGGGDSDGGNTSGGGTSGNKTPDTGFMTGIFNLSTQDFLITGIVIFSIVAMSGIYLLMRDRMGNKAKATAYSRTGARASSRTSSRSKSSARGHKTYTKSNMKSKNTKRKK